MTHYFECIWWIKRRLYFHKTHRSPVEWRDHMIRNLGTQLRNLDHSLTKLRFDNTTCKNSNNGIHSRNSSLYTIPGITS